MMTDPQLTGYFANFMVEVSREHKDPKRRGRRVSGDPHAAPPQSGDLDIYYEDMGDPNDPAVLLIMGLGAQLLLWRNGFLREAGRPGPAGHPLRQPRRRPVQQARRPHAGAALVPRMVALVPRPAQPGGLHAGGHGRRRRRAARPPGHRARPHRRRLDGRHDRPGLRGRHSRRGPRRWASSSPATTSRSCRRRRRKQLLALSASGPPDASPREVIIDNAVRVSRIIGSPGYPAPEEQHPRRRRRGLRPQPTTRPASPAISPRSSAAAACCATTGRSPHRPW